MMRTRLHRGPALALGGIAACAGLFAAGIVGALVLLSLAPFARVVDATGVGDQAGAEQEAPIPGSVTLPPGGKVTFSAPAPPPITGYRLTVTVQSRSDQPAIVSYDRPRTLTIAAPTGFAVQVTPPQSAEYRQCSMVVDQPNVVVCRNVSAEPPSGITFETMPLTDQCAGGARTGDDPEPPSNPDEAR